MAEANRKPTSKKTATTVKDLAPKQGSRVRGGQGVVILRGAR